jgi:DNA-binding NtrC family response regulator
MSTILVVDDEAAMREFYARALVARGYLALESRTAEEALDALARVSDIHVLIADLEMPGRGGAWLVEQLRGQFPHVAVILATANESVPGTLSLQAAVVEYLVKPISVSSLHNAVQKALAWHERQSPAPKSAAGADPIENWLDKKLTHGSNDTDDPDR